MCKLACVAICFYICSSIIYASDKETVYDYANSSIINAESVVKDAKSRGINVDYLKIKINCLRHAINVLSVSDIVPTGKRKDDAITQINDRMINYLIPNITKLNSDIAELKNGTYPDEPKIPFYDLLGDWQIKNGNIYAGNNPIALNGFVWMYGNKDGSYPLKDFGLFVQSVDVGPNALIDDDYRLKSGLINSDTVSFFRRVSMESETNGEICDLHTSPHYLPEWYKSDDHNQWMGTASGRKLLDIAYKGLAESFYDRKSLKMVDIANEWTYWSADTLSMNEFRKWLRLKHKDINTLNYKWQAELNNFSDIPNPFGEDLRLSSGGVYQPLSPKGIYKQRGLYWDWCSFNTEKSASVIQWMNSRLKKYMPSLLTHVKSVLSSNGYRSLAENFILGVDPQKILPITDMIGTDAGYLLNDEWVNTLFAYDYMRSICPDKPIYCSEMHAVPYDKSTSQIIRRGLFQRFIHGERLNLLFLNTTLSVPDWWGMSVDGNNFNIGEYPETFESFALTSADIFRLAEPISKFNDRKPEVLLFYDNAADFNVPDGAKSKSSYYTRLIPIYRSLLEYDIKIGIVTESMLAHHLPDAPLIIIAGAEYISDESINRLSEYVKHGGHIVLFGNNFTYDHYGHPRDKNSVDQLEEHSKVESVMDSYTNYKQIWSDHFKLIGINNEFSINGSEGIEVISTSINENKKLIFIANTNPFMSKISIESKEKSYLYTDLISNTNYLPNDIDIAPEGIMLLSAESVKR